MSCCICGGEIDGCCGIPHFDGEPVSNEWEGPWCGRASCRECYEKHARGEIKTSDTPEGRGPIGWAVGCHIDHSDGDIPVGSVRLADVQIWVQCSFKHAAREFVDGGVVRLMYVMGMSGRVVAIEREGART
jgi:hypothetical protein